MTTNVDGARVRQLRNANTLTVHALAYTAGISAHLLRRIESNHPTVASALTLAQLDHLASTLGVNPWTLLDTDETREPRQPRELAPEPAGADVPQLVSLLAACQKPLRPTIASDTLGWTLRRLQHARGEANKRLAGVGLNVHTHHNGWHITPLNAAVHTPAALARTRVDGLDTQHAKLLYRIHRSRDGWRPVGRLSEDVQISAAYLERAGLIVHTDGAYRLSDSLHQALIPPPLGDMNAS